MPVALTADLIEATAGMFLSPRYDDPRPTAAFHREAWELYCSAHPQVMCIAPRDHAKSTALTMDYVITGALFKAFDYIIIVGSTEPLAQEQLSNISEELHENDDLRREFGVRQFLVDQKTEIIVQLDDGHTFRILARGAEQRIRGRLWKGKRPNLLLCDDMEDDEQVESKDRRRKFRHWFFRAAKQAISRYGLVRVHGTILHDDSLLSRLRRNSTWKHLFYKAHTSFDDFSNILWPERWDEKSLRLKRQEFIEDNDSAGYSQEILNEPMDDSEAYLRKDDFIEMDDDDREREKLMGAAWDFALSGEQHADNTSCTVGGKCVRNLLHVLDERKGKWGAKRIIDEMFSVQQRWNPVTQWVEGGIIWLGIASYVYKEMQIRDKWINIQVVPSIKNKATRGRILQGRHRAGAMRFDKQASWYADYEFELLRFTEAAGALHDDQFDSTSLLCRGFEQMSELEDEDFKSADDWEMERLDPRAQLGRNAVTGY